MRASKLLRIAALAMLMLIPVIALADEYALNLPSTLKSIDSYAFEGCTVLASVYVPESVEIIGDYAFYGCEALSELVIEEGVQSIGEKAFGNCGALRSVTLPTTLNSIHDGAFDGCAELEISATPDTYAWAWAVANGYIEQASPLSVSQTINDAQRIGFRVLADSDWTVQADGDWLEAYGQGEKQTYGSEWHTIYLYFSPNETGMTREATVTFTCEGMQVVHPVVQEPK